MGPKSKSPAPAPKKGKSPSPAPAAKGAGPKKVAGSAAVASSGQPSPRQSQPNSTLVTPTTPRRASLLLQSAGRGLADRRSLGIRHKKALSTKMEEAVQDKLFAHSRFEKQRREKEAALKKQEENKMANRIKMTESFNVSAFEGELDKLKDLVAKGFDVDWKDQQGNHAVGEASVNGQVDVLVYLLDVLHCDPNVKGEYDRTPLWRACFNSHAKAVQLLLERGGDPRIRAQGQLPEELGDKDTKAVLAAWDISKTDGLVRKADGFRAERTKKKQEAAQAQAKTFQATMDSVKTKLDNARKGLIHKKQELERRITEYDFVNDDPSKPPDLKQVALDCVKTAEADVTSATAEVLALQQEFFASKTACALHASDARSAGVAGAVAPDGDGGEAAEEGQEFPFKRLADVVFDDSDGLWKPSGKWPFIQDVTGKTATFLKYRNTIYVDTFSPAQMDPNALRRSLLGCLRYGKPIVFDLRDVPMLDQVQERLDHILPKLFDAVLSKDFRKKEVYSKMLKQPQDGPEYEESKFSAYLTNEATVLFVSSSLGVETEIAAKFALLRVDH